MPGFLEAVVFIAIVMFFISWWPQVAIKVKRYHDLGMTGWNILIEMTLILLPICWIRQGFVKGTDGSNEYGEAPGEYSIKRDLLKRA